MRAEASRVTVRPIGEEDVDALQHLLEECTDYAEQVTGYPTGPSDALSTLLQLPEGLSADRKSVLGLWQGATLSACADVLLGYPDDRTATIGLLAVRPAARRQGCGRRLHEAVLALARAHGLRRIFLAVVDTTADGAVPFWIALGYRPEGDGVPYRYDKLESTARHWTLGL